MINKGIIPISQKVHVFLRHSVLFLNSPKNLDASYKTDLDFWDCFGRKEFCFITEEMWYVHVLVLGNLSLYNISSGHIPYSFY